MKILIIHMVGKFYDSEIRNEGLAVVIFMWFSEGKKRAM